MVDSIHYHRTGQANRKALLDMIARGALEVDEILTHRFSWRKAPEVYRALGEAKNADDDREGDLHRDMVGVLFDWTR